jgi:hypothetical protein
MSKFVLCAYGKSLVLLSPVAELHKINCRHNEFEPENILNLRTVVMAGWSSPTQGSLPIIIMIQIPCQPNRDERDDALVSNTRNRGSSAKSTVSNARYLVPRMHVFSVSDIGLLIAIVETVLTLFSVPIPPYPHFPGPLPPAKVKVWRLSHLTCSLLVRL